MVSNHPYAPFLLEKRVKIYTPSDMVVVLTAATATGEGSAVRGVSFGKTYQADGTTSAGAGTAIIAVQGSNNGTNWDTIGTITLTLATTTSSDSFTSEDHYKYIRGNVTTLSGTDASVNLTMGY
jgi:hypothetical protein